MKGRSWSRRRSERRRKRGKRYSSHTKTNAKAKAKGAQAKAKGAQALRQGRQALVLLPEIALTAEFLTRVEARFGARPAEWHSGVTMTERRACSGVSR